MLKYILEALIFASGHGLAIGKIIESLPNYTQNEIEENIKKLKKSYSGDSGLILIQANDVLQFQSNPKYGDILSDALVETRERELSKTLLQVLAIIAYKQPITRAEIEELRGVNSDYVVSMLLKLGLIDGIGRKETVGRPIIYGTTLEFLKKFGLKSINDLPDHDEIMFKIRNTFDKYFAKTDELYRDPTAKVQVESIKENIPQNENLNTIPDFLKGEDVVEIE